MPRVKLRGFNERHMAVMERAHRRDQCNFPPISADQIETLTELRQMMDDLQAGNASDMAKERPIGWIGSFNQGGQA